MSAYSPDYQASIISEADILPAALRLRDLADAIGGFKVIAADNIASRKPMVDEHDHILAETVFGWSGSNEQWWQNARLALISPVTRACRYESEPFWSNRHGFYTRQPNPYLDKIDLTDYEKRAGLVSVLAFPVHLPLGQIGAVGLVPRDGREDLQDVYDEFADSLAVIMHRFIAGYVKVRRQRAMVPMDCQLTKREVECLRWAAVGKTDREISMILSRSHATIRFHIKNAGEKLNTVNRSQTIFKAAQLGFLGVAV